MKFIPHRLLLCILIIICLLSHKSSCADPQYEACAPKLCGKHTIKFPFYIKDEQESYCGYPGFNLTCKNNEYPILDITGDEYRVDQIFYTNHFIRVSNARLWSSNSSTCYLPQIRNLTLEGDRFQLSSNNFKVVLLSDCSSSRLKEGLLKYRVDCNQDEKEDDWVLAMYLNDTNLSSGIEACHAEVLAPVDQLTTSSNGSNYVELLKRGFALKWTASNCSLCEASDGRCGFDAQGYHKCYCPDRPHFVKCKRITKKNKGSLGLILATAIPGVTFILLICLVFIIWRRKRWSNIFTCFLPRNTSLDIEEGDSYFGVPVFSFKDLEEATHNFDASKELGDGGYGAVGCGF